MDRRVVGCLCPFFVALLAAPACSPGSPVFSQSVTKETLNVSSGAEKQRIYEALRSFLKGEGAAQLVATNFRDGGGRSRSIEAWSPRPEVMFSRDDDIDLPLSFHDCIRWDRLRFRPRSYRSNGKERCRRSISSKSMWNIETNVSDADPQLVNFEDEVEMFFTRLGFGRILASDIEGAYFADRKGTEAIAWRSKWKLEAETKLRLTKERLGHEPAFLTEVFGCMPGLPLEEEVQGDSNEKRVIFFYLRPSLPSTRGRPSIDVFLGARFEIDDEDILDGRPSPVFDRIWLLAGHAQKRLEHLPLRLDFAYTKGESPFSIDDNSPTIAQCIVEREADSGEPIGYVVSRSAKYGTAEWF